MSQLYKVKNRVEVQSSKSVESNEKKSINVQLCHFDITQQHNIYCQQCWVET